MSNNTIRNDSKEVHYAISVGNSKIARFWQQVAQIIGVESPDSDWLRKSLIIIKLHENSIFISKSKWLPDWSLAA